MKTICVLGMGYIGLPTATMFAGCGAKVLGVDVNESVVACLNKGKIHITEPYLEEQVDKVVREGSLTVATEPAPADVFIIAVPTPILSDKKADLSYVKAAAEALLPHLQPGNLVILESTVPPRTTVDILLPILKQSGLRIGDELLIAHCPERVLPGKIIQELVHNNRIVGGVDHCSSTAAKELYLTFVKGEIFVTDATTAEFTKLMENTYRDVNIALANEFALIAESLRMNVWEAIQLANKHPRVNVHQPGPGVGGHCIAVDPWFIVESAAGQANLISMARRINDGMPHHVVERVRELLGKNPTAKIAALGLTYKPNVDDCRESPALDVVKELEKEYRVTVYDPHLQTASLAEALHDADLILLLVNHDDFLYLKAATAAHLVRTRSILDTRNAIDRLEWEAEGFNVNLLGEYREEQTSVCQKAQANRKIV